MLDWIREEKEQANCGQAGIGGEVVDASVDILKALAACEGGKANTR